MIVACVTARNEGATLGPLIHNLQAQGIQVIVVDDGSDDYTCKVGLHAGASMIIHTAPEGIGPSLLEAWEEALRQGADVVIQLDAGGSHDPSVAQWLTKGLTQADIVVGSRFMLGGRYHAGRPLRRLLSKLASKACSRATGYQVHDWTSGYRAFSRHALESLLQHHYIARMHGWQIEVLDNALQDGLRIVEKPITYTPGQSSLDWRVAWEAFWVWAGLRDCPASP